MNLYFLYFFNDLLQIMKTLNVKYLELLNRAYDKYKDIDIIEKPQAEVPATVIITGKISPKKIVQKCDIIKIETKKKNGRKTKKLHDIRPFSPQEDQIILETLRNNDVTMSINILKKKL